MDFTLPPKLVEEVEQFKKFIETEMTPLLSQWHRQGQISRSFYERMGQQGWFGFTVSKGRLQRHSVLRESLLTEVLAKISPGVAVTTMVHSDLGIIGLYLFGSEGLKQRYGAELVQGKLLMCLGNSENIAGSDVAGIGAQATRTSGGWILNGAKAYVTNGAISDLALITAVSDPQALRNQRLSMFLVDLNGKGIERRKLNKQVWMPSDLTRLRLKNVFVPDDHVVGKLGRGLQQVLAIFTNSRVPISALTLGTAEGAFALALRRATQRKIFGRRIIDFQAKAFEAAEMYAGIEAARLVLYQACHKADKRENFRLEASMAKFLAVKTAREVTTWAVDLFGAVSVMQDHPVHKFSMDTWGSSLGEGTQDVQKLIIFREMMKRYRGESPVD